MPSTIAKSAGIHAKAQIEDPVHIGPRAEVHDGCSIGRYTFINSDTVLFGCTAVGRFTTFARRIHVGGVEHPIDHVTTSFFGVSRNWFPDDPIAQSMPLRRNSKRRRSDKTVIGNDVWIGAGAIILKGVTLGDGAVVGAGAVVTKNVEPYAIVAGNPAKVIRYRFDAETRRALMAWQWWNLPPEDIARLPLGDVTRCLDHALGRIEQFDDGAL